MALGCKVPAWRAKTDLRVLGDGAGSRHGAASSRHSVLGRTRGLVLQALKPTAAHTLHVSPCSPCLQTPAPKLCILPFWRWPCHPSYAVAAAAPRVLQHRSQGLRGQGASKPPVPGAPGDAKTPIAP